MNDFIDAHRDFVEETARLAGDGLRRHFRAPLDVQSKGHNDIVTQADLESERLILDRIRNRFPDHGIVAEESGQSGGGGACRWYVDPLDGTVIFAQGIAGFTVSLGVARDGEMLLGAVYDPVADELFWAAKGRGAWCGDRQLRVSDKSRLGDAAVHVSLFSLRREGGRDALMRVVGAVGSGARGSLNLGSQALAGAYVACGRLDISLTLGADVFSMPAAALLITEAGGRVTDFEGQNWSLNPGPMLASNGHLHEQALRPARESALA